MRKLNLTLELYLDGKLKFRKEADPFVANFILNWNRIFGYVGTSVVCTDGVSRSYLVNYQSNINAGAGVSTWGLVVGTGTNAVAISDYRLQTRIVSGNGAGELAYGVVTITAPSTVGSTRSWKVTRTFTNNSGGSITVNEAGIYMYYSSSYFVMEARDLVTPGVVIANTKVGTLEYTFSITV